MPIFQKSVVNKYLKMLDDTVVHLAYVKYNEYFKDHFRLFNIMQLKEENYQEGFLRELFVDVLGYTINPNKNYNLTTEFKNLTDNKKSDGAIIKDNKAIGVIELKSTKTQFLEKITNQAFNYKNNHPSCRYVITSTFHFLRLYIDSSNEFEEFDLFKMPEDEFKRMFLFLCKDSIFNDITLRLKEETKFHEESISGRFYNDYRQFKEKIFENIVKNNSQYDRLIILKKTQKLLDRILFIAFAEDKGLIPPNALSRTIEKWKIYINEGDIVSLYSRFQLFFHHLNIGFTYKDWGVVPAYNGGLFAIDDILDNKNLVIDDNIIKEGVTNIAKYDFNTEIDVNILGHIFEHSLNEIDEIIASNLGQIIDIKQTKRKKEGVFYTPDYITKYIVNNTIGEFCKEKKRELLIYDFLIDDTLNKNSKITKKGREFFEKIQAYKNWLFELKILDPACGSGAFLIQALDYLIQEHKETDELMYQLTGESIKYFDTDKTILEKNIYGVDINEESIEIAKLSLWLHTTKKERKLSDLSNNLKCGNSLIDNEEYAGEKAFDWKKQFPEIMQNDGFDIVIGNPPYVSANNMSFQDREYFNKISDYKTLKGKWDLFIPFVEKSLSLLKQNSLLSFIIPYNFLNQLYAKDLRKYILDNCKIQSIADLHEIRVFEGATIPTCIIVLQKSISEKNIVNIDKFKDIQIENVFKLNANEFKTNEQYMYRTENKETLTPLLDKIKSIGKPLSDYFYVSTGAEIHGKEKRSDDNTLISGHSKFDVLHKDYKQGFKSYIEGSAIPKSKDGRYSFPDIDYYLDYKTDIMRSPKFIELFENEKIIVRRASGKFGIIATFDDRNLYNCENTLNIICKSKLPKNGHGNTIKIDLRFLLGVLNSKLMVFYYNSVYSGYIAIFPNNLKSLPIPVIFDTDQKPLINCVSLLLRLKKDYKENSNAFFQILGSNFGLKKITENLRNFHNFEYKLFIEELGKQKIVIPLKQQKELTELFNTTKNDLININAQIINLVKKIDEIIFDLYSLSDKEKGLLNDIE